MKTLEDIIFQCYVDAQKGEGTTEVQIKAMKEYAKQWVELAATEAGDDNRTVTQNASVIRKMKDEIDAQ